MNPLLRALLGQQVSGDIPVPGPVSGYGRGTFNVDGSQATPLDNEILVEANRNTPTESGPVSGMSAPNDRAVTNVQNDIKRGQEASERKGMFGLKGTLRDVLGIVGDAFLVQGGNDPYYAPRRRQEKISDAWAGASENMPAAAERVGYYDAEMGQGILNEYETNLIKRAQAESLAASRRATAENTLFNRVVKARPIIGGLFNTSGAVQEGRISPRALEVARRVASNAGVSLEDLGVFEDMTEEEVRQYAIAAMNPYQQERLEDADANIEVARRNADSRETSARASMIRAQRPPAGRNPPQPTPTTLLNDFLQIPANQRTPEQQDYITRMTAPSRSQRRDGGSNRNQATPTARRFGPPRN